MSRTASPTPLRQPEVELVLPALHPGQMEVLTDPARFKVVVCGRQWGKTALGATMAVRAAVLGADICWVAPAFHIGELGWAKILDLCRNVPGLKVLGRPTYQLTFQSGGTIRLRSAEDPDSLRGLTLNGVVLDEAAQAKQEAWPVLRPTLIRRRGWALFISTPNGLNWFHDLYQDAEVRRGWKRWRFPSTASPYLPDEEIEQARDENSTMWFNQEYLAEFVAGGAGFFKVEWIQHYFERVVDGEIIYMLGPEAVPESTCRFFHTVDLAWSLAEGADYTVISTWAITPKNHLLLIDWQRGHFEGPDIVPKLQWAYQRRGGVLIVEKATRQMGILQEAVRQGLPVREARMGREKGPNAKEARAWPAAARMEHLTVWFPPASRAGWRDLEQELLAFPGGRHDDFVDTLSYAVAEVASSRSPLAKLD